MHSSLCIEIGERVEAVRVIEAALILAVAAFYFAVVSRGIGTDQLVPNAQIGGCFLKERDNFALGLRETVGKLKAVICLDAFDAKPLLFEVCSL